jgi:hypothetical protein
MLSISTEFVSPRKVVKLSRSNSIANDSNGFPAYCANKRVKVLNQLIDKYDNLIYMDVDSLVKTSLGSLLAELEISRGILIHKRFDSDKIVSKVATGIIALKSNHQTKLFLKQWLVNIEGKVTEWFGDQVSFYDTVLMQSREGEVEMLDSKYIDWMFLEESIIWVGKGNRKYSKIKYQKLQRRFMKLFQDKYLKFSKFDKYKAWVANSYLYLRRGGGRI